MLFIQSNHQNMQIMDSYYPYYLANKFIQKISSEKYKNHLLKDYTPKTYNLIDHILDKLFD